MKRGWRSAVFWFLTMVQWVSALVVVILGAVPRDLSRIPSPVMAAFGEVLKQVQGMSGWVVPLAVLAGVMKFLREQLGSPWQWDLVKSVLDALREVTYKEAVAVGEPVEYHRATLFKHEQFCLTPRSLLYKKWPWEGWLVTVERSGHSTLKEREAFCAPDRAERAHGVAGRTWATQRVLPVIDLPDPGDKAMVAEYARSSFVTTQWVEQTSERARSYIGIPIEVRGKPWGVVVLDSRHPKPPGVIETEGDRPQISQAVIHAYTTAAKTLGKILEPH